jgi:hypothetical protein
VKSVVLVSTIFLTLVFFCPFDSYAQESSPSSELKVEVSFSELPYVKISPNSPAFFLKFLWEKVQLLATRESRQKALLALKFAGKRLSEVVKFASDEENVAMLERAFERRVRLLKTAYELSSAEDKKVRGEIIKQLLLGERFLEDKEQNARSEEKKKEIQKLMKKRTQWLAGLEAGLGEETEGILDANKLRVFESTMAAGVKGDFIENINWQERVERLLFGVKKKILSPYPAPRRN